MLSRGIRANLQMSSTGEVKSIIVVVMCSRNGKACTKNPSIKNNCPFIMYYIRKSALIDRETNKMNDNYTLAVNPRSGYHNNNSKKNNNDFGGLNINSSRDVNRSGKGKNQ